MRAALARSAAAGLVLVPLLAAAPAPVQAQQTRAVVVVPDEEQVDDEPLQSGALTVTDLRPRAPRPDDPFQVLGSVSNTADRPITDVQVQLRLGTRLASRSEIAMHDELEDPQDFPRGERVEVAAELAPGAEQPFDLRTMVAELRMEPSLIGVYPLTIRVTATDDEGTPFTLDEARTYLPWFNDDRLSRQRLAFLVPVVDQPRLGPDEVFVDDVLPELLDAQGRLGSLLGAARQDEQCLAAEPALPEGLTERPAVPDDEREGCTRTPVTFAVDPDLLYSASALTLEHRLRPRGATASQVRPPSQEARSFLQGLTAAAAGPDDLLALPFADPDVVALTRNGSALGEQLSAAQTLGRDLTELLAGAPLDSVALAPPGPVSSKALDALRANGTRAVVLDPSALVENQSTTMTPGTRAPLITSQGPLTGLVVDEALSGLLVRDPGASGDTDPRLLEQRWLVETAMIAAERPNDARTLLVELPRRDPVDPVRVRAALADTGRVPWMCGVTLDAVARGAEACQGEPSAEPEPDRDGALVTTLPEDAGDSTTPLRPALLERVTGLRDDADQFTTAVLAGPEEVNAAERQRYQRAILRTLSSSWRTDPAPGNRLTQALQEDLEAVQRKVVLTAQDVLLTSKDSRLEVAVTNGLDQPVELKVKLDPGNERLEVGPAELVLVRGGSTLPVRLDAETLASGRFQVVVQLFDRNDRPFGDPQLLQIRSTRYGTLALAVTGVAAGVLLVAAGVRITRRALGSRRRRGAPA